MQKPKDRLLLLFFIFISFPMNAQPDWVVSAVSNAAGYTPLPEEEALVVHDHMSMEIRSEKYAVIKARIAYKILGAGGLHHAKFTVPVSPRNELKRLKGWRVDNQGKIHKLEKDAIATAAFHTYPGYYDDVSNRIAVLQDAEPGNIVCFEYEIHRKGWTSSYQNFVFQTQSAVQFSRLEVSLPKEWQIVFSERHLEPVEYTQLDNTHIWLARNLPWRPQEPLAPPWTWLARSLKINCYHRDKSDKLLFENWTQVSAWCRQAYAGPATPSSSVARQASGILAGAETFIDTLRAIARFSRDDIRYVGVEIGDGGWYPREADVTLHNRYGDCKDKATLMRSMLSANGIRSVAVLAATNAPVQQGVPTPFQFNHVIVGIPVRERTIPKHFDNAIVNGWLFFDATDPSTDIGELPHSLQGSHVLIGLDADSTLIRLPYASPDSYRRVYRGRAGLGEDGSLSADIRVVDYGGWANHTAYENRISPKDETESHWRHFVIEQVPGASISAFEIGEGRDSAWVSFTIQAESYLQKAGPLFLLRPDLFRSRASSPLVEEEREHPVWFGGAMETMSKIRWELPGGYAAEVDTLVNLSFCDGASLYSKIDLDDDRLDLTYREQFTGYLVDASDYQAAKTFSKDRSNLRGQTIILKKASNDSANK